MFEALYSQYDYEIFPRTIGTPSQWEVFDIETIDNTRQKYTGKLPLYISHNAHHKNLIFLKMLMFDFDGKEEEVVRDSQILLDHFKNYRMLINYTGNGIHIFIKVKPLLALSSDLKIKKFEVELKQSLNLKTLDVTTIEPKKLTRLLLARYVKKIGDANIRSLRHTIPIRREDLYDMEDVKEMSIQNNYTHINPQYGDLFDASFLVEKDKGVQMNQILSAVNLDSLSDKDFLSFARLVLNSATNLYDIMMRERQSDVSRFRAVVAMKSFGLDEESACQFLARLSKLAGWWDRNIEIQRIKVHQIYSRPYFSREL